MNLKENIQRIHEVMGLNNKFNKIHNNIQEQIPDSRFAPKEVKTDMKSLQDRLKEVQNLSIDDAVDVISAVIDGIPGIGNLVSLGIDLAHTLAYIIRFYFSDNDDQKVEYATLAIITLGASFIPVAGNSLPIMARQGVKQVLKTTPKEILLIAKKFGLYNGSMIFLSKARWKYNLLLVLAKIFGGELSERLTWIGEKLTQIYNQIKNMGGYMVNISNMVYQFILLIQELKKDAEIAIKLIQTKEII